MNEKNLKKTEKNDFDSDDEIDNTDEVIIHGKVPKLIEEISSNMNLSNMIT